MMWNEIKNESDAKMFVDKVYGFHDSCIKEMNYISGAYVEENLDMHPLNTMRCLKLIIQSQRETVGTIEMEFSGLVFLQLNSFGPEEGTGEILEASLVIKEGKIWWYDEAECFVEDPHEYGGNVICAEKMRWRLLKDRMGNGTILVQEDELDK